MFVQGDEILRIVEEHIRHIVHHNRNERILDEAKRSVMRIMGGGGGRNDHKHFSTTISIVRNREYILVDDIHRILWRDNVHIVHHNRNYMLMDESK